MVYGKPGKTELCSNKQPCFHFKLQIKLNVIIIFNLEKRLSIFNVELSNNSNSPEAGRMPLEGEAKIVTQYIEILEALIYRLVPLSCSPFHFFPFGYGNAPQTVS